MIHYFTRRLSLKFLSFGTLTGVLFSTLLVQFAVATNERQGSKISDDSLRVRGVFDSILPGTEEKNSFKLILHPHVGDFEKRHHIRNDLGFSYGITRNWDISAMTRLYFGHGLKDVAPFDELGLADYEIETKYNLTNSLFRGWDSAIDLSYSAPIGNPASGVTDGLIHREGTLSFAKPLESRPELRLFWGLTTDIISQTDIIGRIEKNQLRDSWQRLSGGVVIDQGTFHYTFESAYATTRVWGSSDEDLYSVRPGILWHVPRKFTFNSESQWIVGAAIPVSFGPDGTKVGINVKLRLNFKFNRSGEDNGKYLSSEVESAAERR
ncbi:MAG: hypothetical protein O3C43_04825 [Verrucomicrobia bacterium]|nr:hypothetical protein [Verrucomicrobiota bacterium]MDA1065807.1 hypothetical protein [Verrucomicrobiota bacterium]